MGNLRVKSWAFGQGGSCNERVLLNARVDENVMIQLGDFCQGVRACFLVAVSPVGRDAKRPPISRHGVGRAVLIGQHCFVSDRYGHALLGWSCNPWYVKDADKYP